MQRLNNQDFKWIIKRLPEKVVKVIKSMPDKPESFIIAGGFIRSLIAKEPVNDIDIFTKSKELAKQFADKLKEVYNHNIHISDNAYSIVCDNKLVQVIYRWTFDSPEQIIEHFDFTIAQAAIWLTDKNGIAIHTEATRYDWKSLCSDSFYSDLAAKRLVYTNPPNAEPGSSLLRLLKFRGRDYNYSLISLANIVSRLTGANEEDMIRKLKEVDPGSVDWEEDINES